MKPSLQPVMRVSSSSAMQQLEPLLVLPVVQVATDLYSDRSQTLRAPFSSMLRNWSDLRGLKLRSLMLPVWASVWSRNDRSSVSTRYNLPPTVPAISSLPSFETVKADTFESSYASWVMFHLPSEMFNFFSFPSPPPTKIWLPKSAIDRRPLLEIGIVAL